MINGSEDDTTASITPGRSNGPEKRITGDHIQDGFFRGVVERSSMADQPPVLRVSTTAVVITVVAVLVTILALAVINTGLAVMVGILLLLFGGELLEHVRMELRAGVASPVVTENKKEDALEILRRRYATGELTDRQFERKLEILLATEHTGDVERYLERTHAHRESLDVDLERE